MGCKKSVLSAAVPTLAVAPFALLRLGHVEGGGG